ncbi:MAG: hypothetical protein ACRC2T_00225, partial [Thermoguttaceae bacterium]
MKKILNRCFSTQMTFRSKLVRPVICVCLLGLFVANLTTNSYAIEGDKIFPESTKGFFSISNASQLDDQWKETQIGILMQTDEMKLFWEDLKKQIGANISSRLGMTLDDIRFVPSGEIAGGMIAPVGQTPGFVLLMDITGRHEEAAQLLVQLEKNFEKRKILKDKNTQIAGESATVFTFPATAEIPIDRKAVYLVVKDYLIASDQLALTELIGKRIKGEKDTPLAELPAYATTMNRCAEDLADDESEPVIRWFVKPLEFGESIRAIANLTDKRRARSSIFKLLADAGFDAIQGVGGTLNFKSGELETVHRTYIYAPKPYRGSMKMLALSNQDNFAPLSWMPSDIAGTLNIYVDPTEVFDNIGPLVDYVIMEGEEGTWDNILDSFENDPYGIKMNI